MNKVTFDITLSKIRYKKKQERFAPLEKEYSKYRTGEVTIDDFPFVPFPGLHLGDWQIVNVCQVYYLGVQDGKPVFHANCEHVNDPACYGGVDNPHEQWPTLEELEAEIIKRTKMDWVFKDEREAEE